MRFVFYALKESRTYVGQHPAFAHEKKIHRPFRSLFRRFCIINLLVPGEGCSDSRFVSCTRGALAGEREIRESRRRNAPRFPQGHVRRTLFRRWTPGIAQTNSRRGHERFYSGSTARPRGVHLSITRTRDRFNASVESIISYVQIVQ